MKKNVSLIILSFIIVVGVIMLFKNKVVTGPAEIILFYGDGCPHCELVEEYVAKNNIESKVIFSRLEVFRNKENQELFIKLASGCGVAKEKMGVPLLWDGAACYQGDQEIINFFAKKSETK